MKDNWHDKNFAVEWDETSNVGNPTRKAQLQILTRMVKAIYQQGTTIVDLGFGSGQIEELLFQTIPDAKIVGIDSSKEMISIADERLRSYKNNYSTITHDLTEIPSLELGAGTVGVVLRANSIHPVT
jgi:ubiquinone/menaquinone biosynthesis C-methylase UbiE